MTVVCLVLGIQQVALKSSAADMSPVLQLAVRSGIAAALVLHLLLPLEPVISGGHCFVCQFSGLVVTVTTLQGL